MSVMRKEGNRKEERKARWDWIPRRGCSVDNELLLGPRKPHTAFYFCDFAWSLPHLVN